MMDKFNVVSDFSTSNITPHTTVVTAFSIIQSEHASKYLTVLCRHFSRKVEAKWDDHQGTITFSIGITSMQVNQAGNELSIMCESENEALLEEQKSVIERHVTLFTQRESITLVWKEQNTD